MKKNKFKKLLTFFLMMTVFSSPAFCQNLRGVVMDVNEQDKSFTLRASVPTKEKPFPIASRITVSAADTKTYEGIKDFSQLRAGEVVTVEAVKSDKPDKWKALAITRL